MTKSFFIFLLGILIGAVGWHYYLQHAAGTSAESKPTLSAKTVGERVGDAGIITLIKGKYVMDRDLSALAIGVECTNGHVTLSGTVASAELAARAGTIASQTKGVTEVSSRLAVKN